jgi:hypothetical protein
MQLHESEPNGTKFYQWVKYHSIKAIKSTYLCYKGCWKCCLCTRMHARTRANPPPHTLSVLFKQVGIHSASSRGTSTFSSRFPLTLLWYAWSLCGLCPSNYLKNKSFVRRSGKCAGHKSQLTILSPKTPSKAKRESCAVLVDAESGWNNVYDCSTYVICAKNSVNTNLTYQPELIVSA